MERTLLLPLKFGTFRYGSNLTTMREFRPIKVWHMPVWKSLVSFITFAASLCSGQGPAQPLTLGTVVLGQCTGHVTAPGCVLPNLFGPGGLTVANNPVFPHYAHFTGVAQSTINQTLSTAIATQLAILPIISPASGFTYKYDSAAGAFVRSTLSFGPIYTERAETIGRGKVYFGTSYQRFRFSTLDGIDLHSMPAVFTHVPNTGPGGTPEPYESDVISTVNNVGLNMDQIMFFGTVGITDRVDVSVAVPIVSVRLTGTSKAGIIRVSGPTFVPAPGAPSIPNPHQFDTQGSLTHLYSSSGSATGIGDVTFRIKGNLLRTENLSVALAADVRVPSGDAQQFLGSGATGIKPFIAISAPRRISPHLNLGYQWNGSSILAGNITGTIVGEDAAGNAVIQNGPATKQRLPGQFFYSAGVDVGVTKSLSVAVDYLGQAVINAPRVFRSQTITGSIPGGTGALTLPTIAGGKDTVGLNSGATGFKYNLFGQLLLTADILFRLDNKGLRQNVTPLIALSYAFGR
jgi:hypothetical protein